MIYYIVLPATQHGNYLNDKYWLDTQVKSCVLTTTKKIKLIC